MEHTPGPWRRFGGYMDGYGIVGDGKTVVKLVGDDSMDLDRQSADATLIAAAPDLLEACKEALATFEHHRADLWPLSSEMPIVSQLRNVLAAAERR